MPFKEVKSSAVSDIWSFACTILELFTEHDIWDLQGYSQQSCSSDEPEDMVFLKTLLEKEEQPHAHQHASNCVAQVVFDIV